MPCAPQAQHRTLTKEHAALKAEAAALAEARDAAVAEAALSSSKVAAEAAEGTAAALADARKTAEALEKGNGELKVRLQLSGFNRLRCRGGGSR